MALKLTSRYVYNLSRQVGLPARRMSTAPTPFPSSKPLPSHWLSNVHLENPDAPQGPIPSDLQVDCAIIGGGISGFSAAYHLSRLKPQWTISLLDSRPEVAGGATGRNGALCWPGLSDSFNGLVEKYGLENTLSLLHFDFANVAAMEAFTSSLSKRPSGTHLDPQFHLFEGGGIMTFHDSEDFERAKKDLKGLEDAGVADHGITLWESKDVEIQIGFKGSVGAGHNKHARHIVPARFVHAMATEFLLGAEPGPGKPSHHRRVFSNATVTGISTEKSNDAVMLLTTTRGNLKARHVIHATNAWSTALLPHLPIVPIRNQVIITSPIQRPSTPSSLFGFGPSMCISANHGYEYMSTRDDGRIALGGMRNIVAGMEVGVSDDSSLIPLVSKALREYLPKHFPHLPPITVEKEWAGIMGWSVDGLPYVGAVPDVEGRQWIAAGYSGHGMPRAFLCGKAVAEMCAGVKERDWEFPEEMFKVTRKRLMMKEQLDGFQSR
ncbi:hypothetical protein HDU97_000395 [Phlyctochytrium planicorne]|nr:hypothetical protein HDU97_000395 [Phlyctochytrium planicorne]